MLRRAIHTTAVLWLILTIPWCYIVVSYAMGASTYGQFIHISGDMSAWLLMVALAATPLRLIFPRQRWTIWLLQRRRYFGVASFLYAVPHVVAYVIRLPGERIAREALDPGMALGWLALAIFLPLAVTSNDWSTRVMGARWRKLHRAVYAAAILTFAHWVMTAFDPTVGTVHLAVLLGLESYRMWRKRGGKPA